MGAARAAKLLGDDLTERRWLEALGSTDSRRAMGRSARVYAQAMRERAAGSPYGAVAPLREALALLDGRPAPLQQIVLVQELVEALVASGDRQEATALLGPLLDFYGTVKATWYVGRLEAWAQGLGVDVTAR